MLTFQSGHASAFVLKRQRKKKFKVITAPSKARLLSSITHARAAEYAQRGIDHGSAADDVFAKGY